MKEIKNPKFLVFLKTEEGKVAQVVLTDEQDQLVSLTISAITEGKVIHGKEMEIRYDGD